MGRLRRGGRPLLALAGILAEHGEGALLPSNHLEQGWFPGGDLFLSTLDGGDNISRLLNPLTVAAKPFRHLRILAGEKLEAIAFRGHWHELFITTQRRVIEQNGQ